NTSARRRALRELALDIRARMHAARSMEPATLLLNFRAGDGAAESVDLLLLRPSAAIVGAVRAYGGPIETLPGGQWRHRDTGPTLHEQPHRTPIQHVKLQRDAVRARLDAAFPDLLREPTDPRLFERMVGALIIVPTTHPDSRVSLDIGDHRQQLKVLG